MNQLLLITRRAAAFWIDWLVFCVGSFPFAQYYWFGGLNGMAETRLQTALLWAWVLYFVIFEWAYGATVGKFICRLVLKQVDGRSVRLWTVLLRTTVTFIAPCGLSLLAVMAINATSSTDFAGRIALVIGIAIVVAVPLSVVFFHGQSFADVLFQTCVVPVEDSSTAVNISSRRWLLVGLASVFIGLACAWGVELSAWMIGGSQSVGQNLRNFVNRYPPNLFPSTQMDASERQMMLGVRGNILRQPEGLRNQVGKEFVIGLYGDATTYDELVVMKRIAADMAALPDDERPKCVTVDFVKDFEAVLSSLQQRHEMMVCDVPGGSPDEARLVDVYMAADLHWKFDPTYLWATLFARGANPIRIVKRSARLVDKPPNHSK